MKKWYWKCPKCGRPKLANTQHVLFPKWQAKGKANHKDLCWGCRSNVTMNLVELDTETAELQADSVKRGAPERATTQQILSAWTKL